MQEHDIYECCMGDLQDFFLILGTIAAWHLVFEHILMYVKYVLLKLKLSSFCSISRQPFLRPIHQCDVLLLPVFQSWGISI